MASDQREMTVLLQELGVTPGNGLARADRDEIETLPTARTTRRARVGTELVLEAIASAIGLLHAKRDLVRAFARLPAARHRTAGPGDKQPRAITAGARFIAADREPAGMQRSRFAPQ